MVDCSTERHWLLVCSPRGVAGPRTSRDRWEWLFRQRGRRQREGGREKRNRLRQLSRTGTPSRTPTMALSKLGPPWTLPSRGHAGLSSLLSFSSCPDTSSHVGLFKSSERKCSRTLTRRRCRLQTRRHRGNRGEPGTRGTTPRTLSPHRLLGKLPAPRIPFNHWDGWRWAHAVPRPRSLQTQQQPGRFPPGAGQQHGRGSPGPRELPGRPCLTSSRAQRALPPARPPVFCRESLLLTEALHLHGQDTRVRLMGDVLSLRSQRGEECPP